MFLGCACPGCSKGLSTFSASLQGFGQAVPEELKVDGTAPPGDDLVLYEYELVAGQTYLFSAYGSGDNPLEDTVLYVADDEFSVLGYDDDGGVGRMSILTYTATYTGTHIVAVGAYPDLGLSGDFTLDVVEWPGEDTVPAFVPTVTLELGEVVTGFIDSDVGPYAGYSEVDSYSITLTAGTIVTIEVAGGGNSFTSLAPGELDTVIELYDANGNFITGNDDIAFPGDVSSSISFLVSETGVYSLDVFAYSDSVFGPTGYQITTSVQDLADLDPLETIIWDSAANVPFDDSNTAYVYFAGAGETFGETADDGTSPIPSFGWNEREIQQVMTALGEYSKILGTNYEITTDVEAATFRLLTTTSEQYGAYFYPQDPGYGDAQGIGAFNVDSGGWDKAGFSETDLPGDQISLEQGGYAFAVILHEFGHAHGLAHPHDRGGGSEIMPGVTSATGTYGVFNLNQGIYTVMSYNDAWDFHPDGPTPFSLSNLDSGWSGTLSAFDIAALQERYGVINDYATGDNVYLLGEVNDAGTYYETIWDTAGVDVIQYDGARNAQIDLLAATIDYSPTGGGVVSFVDDIWGGYLIARGVVIENATGGSGNDVLLGNAADNVLTGNDGDDQLFGREGNDTLIGGRGNNTLTGGAGNDTFIVSGAYLNASYATITDWEEGDTFRINSLGNGRVRYEEVAGDTIVYANGVAIATIEDTSVREVLASQEYEFTPRSIAVVIDGVATSFVAYGGAQADTLNGRANQSNNISGLGG
ncbi:M10 family metallopeptidase C-terminal domain-containing protein, partial [Croceibacterium ferulae]|uniref:M10 family metallopeptidase C-terminal domain-containing protein n=1 Tax=Croceibacterium ferulae TaxID=1854641 RepID=UPI000EAB5A67